jgi:hypothetical protein
MSLAVTECLVTSNMSGCLLDTVTDVLCTDSGYK